MERNSIWLTGWCRLTGRVMTVVDGFAVPHIGPGKDCLIGMIPPIICLSQLLKASHKVTTCFKVGLQLAGDQKLLYVVGGSKMNKRC